MVALRRGLDGIVRDVRLAGRSWRRTPGVALAAITTLALGTGATTAIFSVVSGVLIRPLPFAEPDRIVQLAVSSPTDPSLPPTFVTFADLDLWRAAARTLTSVSTYSAFSANLTSLPVPERVATLRADRAFFPTLGVAALHGRTFGESDPDDVAVASYRFWVRHLAADPSAIGRRLTLDGQTFTLVGVMPARFDFPHRATPTDLWTPWAPRPVPNGRLDAVVGRMAPGSGARAVRDELTALSATLVPGRFALVTPVAETIPRPVRQSLLVLLGAVGLLLLAAVANVANLLLVRAAARRHEIAVRAALGAGRWPLLRQSLAESLLLAGAGSLAGLILGRGATSILVNLASGQLPRAAEIGFDWRVFAFVATVCVATSLILGVLPALESRHRAIARDLQPGHRASGRQGALQHGLVIAEIALAFVLIAGAGLLLRTFVNLQRTHTGFQTAGVLTLHVAVTDAEEAQLLVERVSAVPGVTAAGFISLLPLQQSDWNGRFTIEGRPGEGTAEFRYVTPDYFRVMRIPLVRGRSLSARDTAATEKVLLVNETFAATYLPDDDPVGRILTDRGRIVGVVGDVRQARLDRPASPEIYYPVAQNFAQLRSIGSTMVVRSARAAGPLLEDIRRAVREVRPTQAIFQVATMDDVIAHSIGRERLSLWLLGVFAGIGIILAATGIYAVVGYLVTTRIREFGIRAALGAGRGQLLGLVLRRGAGLAGTGLVLGVGGVLVATRFLETLLFGVGALDPAILAAGAAILGAVALGACAVPAVRAARVDPVRVLRRD